MENKRSLFSAIPSAIIFGIIVGMITYFGLNFGGYKEYQAQAKVVTTNIENINDAAGSSATYAATINSPKIKQKTLETLEIDWNTSKLDNKLEIRPVDNSSIIDIVVTDTNKLRAEDLADQYADYTVRVLNNIYNSGAKVMEYSYGTASPLDNTLRYALITGGIGFVLWTLIDMIYINSSNKKLAKTSKSDVESKEAKEVESKPAKKARKTEEKEYTKEVPSQAVSYESASNQVSEATQVIDKDEIERASETKLSSNKYEVLGRIPSYKKGDLDV
ncbi:chain-length determining protein [uncultured Anaerococcus sp.]|uniref:chain-length determining protein n=1 Tax=uncultured Anaerococcus sp. TaxID=293428 RepID=UPI002624AB8E|nr:chain-length determining protein [uncultured Anaerococcus sp.]